MEETIFFNRGNAIANAKDDKDLMRAVQVEKDQRNLLGKLIVVEDPESGEQIVFELADQKAPSDAATAFKVKKVIE